MKKNKLTIVTAGLLVAVLAIYTLWFMVPAGSVGVIKQLGAIKTIKQDPGIYFKLPWPFQTENIIDIRLRTLEIKGSENLTKDKFNLITSIALGWRIRNTKQGIRDFWNTCQGSVDEAESKISDRARSVRFEILGGTNLHQILSTDSTQAKSFSAIETRIQQELQKGLDDAGYGIEIDYVYLQSVKVPKEVTEKIFTRMEKERQRISSKFISEGKSQAKIILSNAELEVAKKIAKAKADFFRIKGEADAAAAEYYKIYNQNPELANWLREAEAMEKILANKRSTIILQGNQPLRQLIPVAPKTKSKQAENK